MMRWLAVAGLCGCCLPLIVRADEPVAAAPRAAIVGIAVDPPALNLQGAAPRFQLLVTGQTAEGRQIDLTAEAEYQTSQPERCVVAGGLVTGRSDGQAELEVRAAGHTLRVPVQIAGSQTLRAYNFENDIVPILSKFGCNASGCHGKAEGQNGFKLSVFGFDPKADFVALTQEGRGRRVNPALPDQSLLITKAANIVPHGGGMRIGRTTEEYALLRDWIARAMPFGNAEDPRVVSIELTPKERTLSALARQQLRVVATYSDGRRVDVTRHARFQSNNEGIAAVDDKGLISVGQTPGEAAIMANYMGAVDVFLALIPRVGPLPATPAPPVYNFIDGLVDQKLQKLNIAPSGLCTDADYLRRVYLDLIGTLPTAAEAREFLADTRPDRRARLVDRLLERPEYANYWALKWADVLRVDRQALQHRGAYLYYQWIRESLANNLPYDQFARQVVAAEGPLAEAPGGHFFKAVTKPGDMASTLSQVFLGVRIECAQCHHHPFDRWSQDDYWGMQGLFTQVSFKKTSRGEALVTNPGGETRHPRSNAVIYAHPLGTPMPEQNPEGDRRRVLADWLTQADNSWFAKSFANRMWAHFLGRGLVEPVDDFRLTNPATNPELLDALAAEFVRQKYDVKAFIRTVTASRTYQLSAIPNETNERDAQNYSRMLFKRLDAEVLFDAVCQTTGVGEKFDGVPAGTRAIELWDSRVPHYFLRLFGRPSRLTACECERTVEPSVGQVLHVLNSPEIQAKLAHAGGRLVSLLRQLPQDEPLVDELYLTCFARYPTPEEKQTAVAYLESHKAERTRAAEDLLWSLMNTLEFVFNH